MDDEFQINSKTGVRALMYLRDGKFIVRKDSMALKETPSEMTSYVSLKNKLIETGSLVPEGDFFRFAKDVPFESVSGAAAVVLDRNANGNREWRHRATGKIFGDWLASKGDVISRRSGHTPV